MEPFSAQDFATAVLDAATRLAVFDCDGTLWAPDTGHGFMEWSFAQGLVEPERQAWLEGRYAEYEAGRVDEETICGEMVAVYAGLSEAELTEAAARFFREHIAREVFAPMLRVVCTLAERGVELWAVSSTARWVVAAGLAEAGYPIAPGRVLAAEVAVVEGRLTGTILPVPTGVGKRAALERQGVSRPDAAFGNSVHDAAMMRMASRAFPVNPSPALLELAAAAGWRVFLPGGGTGRAVGGAGGGLGGPDFESNGG